MKLRTQIHACSCSGFWLSSRIRLHYFTLFYLTLQISKRRQFTAKQCKDLQESLCRWPRSHSCGMSWPRWPRWGWHEARTRWRTRRRREGPVCDVFSSRSARTVPVRRRPLWESWSSSVYVLLTVLLSIILDNDQLDTHLLYFTIYLLHSCTCFEHYVLIFRRLNCIDAASGIVLWKQVSSLGLLECNLVYY